MSGSEQHLAQCDNVRQEKENTESRLGEIFTIPSCADKSSLFCAAIKLGFYSPQSKGRAGKWQENNTGTI
ncbi:hypothetical protein D5272_15585 [bacterium D16-76]|nr:hypothetical protein [bacterium D16-76]